ncbi:SecDF P1 head subdomain-containing protein [Sorangium sp. So ce1000]|uniref:SecDF P1 head subdomain-containing protein n=1 Tax=Sorangium sp. So ce1000 TaxID=3133325 RepID=UPI003F5DF639
MTRSTSSIQPQDRERRASPAALWGGLALTLAAPLLLRGGQGIGLPGVELPPEIEGNAASGSMSVFALGVMPFVTATLLVELAALVVPRWAALRHGGPAGRAELGRAALLLGSVIALAQAASIAKLAATMGIVTVGITSSLLFSATLMAGAACALLLADAVSAYGLASGLAVLTVLSPLLDEVERLFRRTATSPAARLQPEALTPVEVGALALGAVFVVLSTCYALRSPPPVAAPPAGEGGASYRAAAERPPPPPLSIATPMSGIVPLTLTASLLTVPGLLGASLGAPFDDVARFLSGQRAGTAAALLTVIALGVALSWAFHLPERVAAVVAATDPEGRSRGALEAEARAAMPRAIARTLVYVVALLAVSELTSRVSGHGLNVVALALATALALDVAAEWRARRAMPDLAPVWPEHRPYALDAARAALQHAGIPVHARGEHQRRLLQFFGPYVPIVLMVPRGAAKRAEECLAAAFLPPARDEEDDPASEADEDAPAEPAAPPRARGSGGRASLAALPIGALALLSAGLLLLPTSAELGPESPAAAPPRPAALEVLAVDDEIDLSALGAPPEPMAPGVSLKVENPPVGPGRTAPRTFVRIVPRETETLDAARARLLAWVEETYPVPSGRHFMAGYVDERDERDNLEHIGWRTYLVRGPATITGHDVASAQAALDDRGEAYVSVELTDEGRERFAELSRESIKRRIAIVVDGIVLSAPVVQQAITGGRVQITMAHGDPAEQMAQAEELAAALGTKPPRTRSPSK